MFNFSTMISKKYEKIEKIDSAKNRYSGKLLATFVSSTFKKYK